MKEKIFNILYPFLVQEGVVFEFIQMAKCDIPTHIDKCILSYLKEYSVKKSESVLQKHMTKSNLIENICHEYIFKNIDMLSSGKQPLSERWTIYYDHQMYLQKLGMDFETNILP